MEVEVDKFSCIATRVACNTTCSLFLEIIVILAFSLAKTSVATNNTSINPSSPSDTRVYSLSLVTFASPFSSFKIFDQSYCIFRARRYYLKFYWRSLLLRSLLRLIQFRRVSFPTNHSPTRHTGVVKTLWAQLTFL